MSQKQRVSRVQPDSALPTLSPPSSQGKGGSTKPTSSSQMKQSSGGIGNSKSTSSASGGKVGYILERF